MNTKKSSLPSDIHQLEPKFHNITNGHYNDGTYLFLSLKARNQREYTYRIGVNGSEIIKLFEGTMHAVDAENRTICFMRQNPDTPERNGLYIISFDGTQETCIYAEKCEFLNASGRNIYFTHEYNDIVAIYSIKSDRTELTKLTE